MKKLGKKLTFYCVVVPAFFAYFAYWRVKAWWNRKCN